MAWYDKWVVMVIAAAIGVAGYNCIRWADIDATILAYWVQAIGSIAAIVAAFLIGNSQRNADRHLDAQRIRHEKNRRVEVISSIFSQILALSMTTRTRIENGDTEHLGDYSGPHFAHLLNVTKSIPVFEMPDRKLARYILIAAVELSNAHNAFMLLVKEAELFGPPSPTEIPAIIRLETALEILEENAIEGITRCEELEHS